MAVYSLDKLMAETRRLAAEYRRMTGQPLAVSGEIAKYDACRLLNLEPQKETGLGHDAVGRNGRRFVIKGRAIFDESKGGQRLGQLKADRSWDSVLLVLMDEEFQTSEIWEADRSVLEQALQEAEGRRRSRRGALSVAKFKALGNLAWAQGEGVVDDEVWKNY